ncbi:MAG: acyl carrier protein [Nitrospirales bacterium]|nr:acyl carrier protein [Nitrospirales bacterium]
MPSYQDILPQVYEILRQFTPEGKSPTEDMELVADLGLASMQVMELLLEIEDQFDVSVPLNILPDVKTVKDLVTQLEHITSQP